MKLFSVVSEVVINGKKETTFLFGPAENADDAADWVDEQLMRSVSAISNVRHLAIEAIPDDVIRAVAAALDQKPNGDAEILAAIEAVNKAGAVCCDADDDFDDASRALTESVRRHYPGVTIGSRISLGGRLFRVNDNSDGNFWLAELDPTAERGAA